MQLKNGVNALRMPSDNLLSNWAYMVMAALAWNLKAWYGLLARTAAVGQQIVRMEFKRFLRELHPHPLPGRPHGPTACFPHSESQPPSRNVLLDVRIHPKAKFRLTGNPGDNPGRRCKKTKPGGKEGSEDRPQNQERRDQSG